MDSQIDDWLDRRSNLRRQLAEQNAKHVKVASALAPHDLVLEAILELQSEFPSWLSARQDLDEFERQWLALVALVFQQLEIPRVLILEGAYPLAAAAMKQEWDGLSTLISIRKRNPKFEKSPNVKNTLGKKAHTQHRLLQPIAHLTGEGLGTAWGIEVSDTKEVFMPMPRSLPDLAARLLNSRSYFLIELFQQIELFLGSPVPPAIREKIIKAAKIFGS